MEFLAALPALAVVAALLQPVAIVGAAALAYRLGRGAAEEDRVRAVESSALAETRSWLLDAIEVIDAAAQRDWGRLRRLAAKREDVRYERQLAELIADDSLLDMLCEVLPSAYEQLPRVSAPVRERVAQLGAELRHSCSPCVRGQQSSSG